MSTSASPLPQLDLSKSVPLTQTAQASTALPKLDLSKSIPLTSDAVAARHARANEGKDMSYTDPNAGESGWGGLATGFENEAGKSGMGLAKLVNKVLPESVQIPISANSTENHGVAENLGGAAENIAEFATGDAALDAGLAKAQKLVQAANASPLLAATLRAAKEHPILARIIESTAKSAAVGGTQGAAKGAAEDNATGGAVGGAIGGAGGALVGELAGTIAEPLAKKFGVGTTAIEDAKMGARPAKRNQRFASDFLRAAPYLDSENSANAASTVEDWANHARNARENLFANEVQPLIDRHADVPLGGKNIADGIRAQIPDAMKRYSPTEAVKMEQLANDFMPQQKFQLNVADAEDALEHFNAKLASTGYWSKMPSERAALEKTDGTIAGYKAAADAIRDELYGKLDQLEPNSNMRGLKQDYGALRNVENEIRGRVNVNDRQAPISLKETIGLITGLGHGGVVGGAMAAFPILDRIGNSPQNLISRAVDKAVSKPSTFGKAVSGAIESAPAVGGYAGSQVGQAVAESEGENETHESK
jgi:hypothetical protein